MGAVKRTTAKIMSREKSTFKIYCHCDVVCTFTLYMPNKNRANQKQNRSKHQNTVPHPMNQNKHQANSSKANAIKIKCTLIGLLNDWYIIHCEWHARASRDPSLPSTSYLSDLNRKEFKIIVKQTELMTIMCASAANILSESIGDFIWKSALV